MKARFRAGFGAITVICLSLGFAAYTQSHSSAPNPVQKGTAMPAHASGTFEVELNPQTPDGKFEDATLARMTIDKQSMAISKLPAEVRC